MGMCPPVSHQVSEGGGGMLPRLKILSWECVPLFPIKSLRGGACYHGLKSYHGNVSPPVSHQVSEGDMLPRLKILSWECVPPVSHQVSEGDMLSRLKILSWECVPLFPIKSLRGTCYHSLKSYHGNVSPCFPSSL